MRVLSTRLNDLPAVTAELAATADPVWHAADAMFRMALSLGGTLTGEHGVGLLKRRWPAQELGADYLALQREIKALFDPHGILNPGKAL